MRKKAAAHEEIRDAFSDIYNNLYRKFHKELGYQYTNEEWKEILKAGSELADKYNTVIAQVLVNSLITQLEYNQNILEQDGNLLPPDELPKVV